MEKIRLGTVFSGIGAIEESLLKNDINHEIVFACDNGEIELKDSKEMICKKIKNLNKSEKEKYVNKLYEETGKRNYIKDAYFANYKISEDKWFSDIRFLDGNKYKNKVDLFVGGSPCQSFSIIGKRKGLEDARGTLFFEYARLVKEIEPKVFIYENVSGMLSHDNGNTWSIIENIFKSLDYEIYFDVLNSVDYGIPQRRKRLFVIGFKNKDINFRFPIRVGLNKTLFDFLENEPVATRHYLGKKGFEFVTNPKYKNRARVNNDVIQTEKANQQFNWNGDFVFIPLKKAVLTDEIKKRAYIGEWNNEKGIIRQLTYRECMRLMGFDDSFKIVVPNVPAYREAGNSIVVNVFDNILKSIIETGVFKDE